MKRILSFVLSAIMIVSCLVVPAMADDAVNNVISLIDQIGEVNYYRQTTGMTFSGGNNVGYSQLNTNPTAPYDLTFELIVGNHPTEYTTVSSFGPASNGGGGAYYDFYTKRFVINNNGFNYGGYNENCFAASDVIDLVPGEVYTITFHMNEKRTAVSVNGEVVVTCDQVIYNGYCIVYPKDCTVHILDFKYAREDGVVIDQRSTEGYAGGNLGEWVAMGGAYKGEDICAALGDKQSLFNSIGLISAAEAACAGLSDAQLAQVTNLSKLTEARKTYDQMAADYATAIIEDAYTTKDYASATEAYSRLTDAQKALVTNYEPLMSQKRITEAEAAIESIGSLALDDDTAVGGAVTTINRPTGYGWYNDLFSASEYETYVKDTLTIKMDFYTRLNEVYAAENNTSYMAFILNNDAGSPVLVGYDYTNNCFFIDKASGWGYQNINPNNTGRYVTYDYTMLAGAWYNWGFEYTPKGEVIVYLNGEEILNVELDLALFMPSVWLVPASCNVTVDNWQWYDTWYADGTEPQPVNSFYTCKWTTIYGDTIDETTVGAAANTAFASEFTKYIILNEEERRALSNNDVLVATAEALGFSVTDYEVIDVTAAIDALGEITDLSQADAVNAVQKMYDALSDSQKAKILNADILAAAQTMLADIEVANEIMEDIKELEGIETINDIDVLVEATVVTIMEKVDELTWEQYMLVENIDVLYYAYDLIWERDNPVVEIVHGDVTGDGLIDLKDVVLMIQYCAGWDVELYNPYEIEVTLVDAVELIGTLAA